jgi:outer membrane protein
VTDRHGAGFLSERLGQNIVVRNLNGRSTVMTLYRNLLLLLVFVLTSSPALAADVKIGFFDMQKVVERSEIGKSGAEKLRQEQGKLREQQEAKVKEIQGLEGEFKKKENVWSQDVKKKKAQDIMSKRMELDRAAREANRQLLQLQEELLRPLQNKVFDIVMRLGKEGSYTMILEMRQAGLVYALPSLELTDQIIRELNQSETKEQKKSESKKP